MAGGPSLRVLVVAHDAEVGGALRERLERDGMVTAGVAADEFEAYRLATEHAPDLCVVVDVRPVDGAALAARLAQASASVRVVLLSAEPTDARLLAAVEAGAAGYLGADPQAPRLSAALADVVAGRPAFPRRLEALLIAGLADEAAEP